MPPLAPEHYVPAFAACVAVIGALVGALKILWARYLTIADRLHDYEGQQSKAHVRALTLSTEVIRANTEERARAREGANAQ